MYKRVFYDEILLKKSSKKIPTQPEKRSTVNIKKHYFVTRQLKVFCRHTTT